jgi:Holliday junction resolvase RusA-like endonuclease
LKKRLRRVEKPCEIFIEWHEKTKRRDCDNIQSAQKFILDALQHCKIIENDSRKYIKQIHHTVIDDKRDFVTVRFEEKEN